MRVFFTASFAGKANYQVYIDEIVSVLRKREAGIISLEMLPHQKISPDLEAEEPESERSDYAFITHGIAEADIVIVEASHDDFRVGHEVTLALLYGKPTLVLSQHADYSKYITHELLFGVKYTTKRELRKAVNEFLKKADTHLSRVGETIQAIGGAADSLHMAALATSRHQSLRDDSEFGIWARLAEKNPEQAYAEIQKALGNLPIHKPWSVFAPIYNEDTPDYIFSGVARFIRAIFTKYDIRADDPVADAATGTGALARNLTNLGYRNIIAFDTSREMLAEAFRLCAHIKTIKLLEADLATAKLPTPVKGAAWIDYSSNFALTPSTLRLWLQNLLDNISPGGCLIFDIRTVTGWRVNFFHQKVTTFGTNTFQRIWINKPDYDQKIIMFDLFIRVKQPDGTWGEWRREQMKERMWSLDEVHDIVATLQGGELDAIYGDTFSKLKEGEEPGLAYVVIKKLSSRKTEEYGVYIRERPATTRI